MLHRPSRKTLQWAALACLAAVGAAAQAWPDKPLKVIIPFPPGGPTDIVMRLAAERMQHAIKQPIVIENKAGAGGNLGAAEVSRASPDGHTWLWAPDTVVTVNPHVYKKLGFVTEDLVAVSIGASFSQTLVCNAAAGPKTLADFVKVAKASKQPYASGGAGVPGHLAMELLLYAAGIEMEHVPYKGPAPAVQDVLGGQVPCGFLAGPTVLPHVQSGKLRALAVSGATRSPALPDVPTVAEAGFAGFDATFMLVAMAPRGTPEAIVGAFQKALADALKDSGVEARLRQGDQVVVASSPAQAAAAVAAASRKWGEVAKRINLSLD